MTLYLKTTLSNALKDQTVQCRLYHVDSFDSRSQLIKKKKKVDGRKTVDLTSKHLYNKSLGLSFRNRIILRVLCQYRMVKLIQNRQLCDLRDRSDPF